MNQYSHAILAKHLQPRVQPEDPAEYLWGALAPDVRYVAGMRRQDTHLTDEEIARWFERYPRCRSFIQGYRVHCLLDRIDTVQVVGRAFPLNLLRRVRRKPFSYQQIGAVVELYYQKKFPQGLQLTGGHNPILQDLGVRSEQSTAFADGLASYLARPCFETGNALSVRLGLVDDTRLEKYKNAYLSMQRSPVLLWVLMTSVKHARLETLAESLYKN